MVSLFETAMLVCFGFSWPLNVMKAYRARTAKGMSLPFILLIITGYVAGICAKFLSHAVNYVLVVYFINLSIVSVNLLMYFRNRALDRAAEKTSPSPVVAEENTNTLHSANLEDYIVYSYAKEIDKYKAQNARSIRGGVVIFGDSEDKEIPVSEIRDSIGLEERVYNRSFTNLAVAASTVLFEKTIAPIAPSCILVHIGSSDREFFNRFPGRFDHDFRTLLQRIKTVDASCRIGVVALQGSEEDVLAERMNEQLKYIAESEKCEFCRITPDTRWSPDALSAADDYYYSTGYARSAKTPVYDYAKMFFAKPVGYEELPSEEESSSAEAIIA